MKAHLAIFVALCACTPQIPSLNTGISRNDKLDYDIPDRIDSSYIAPPVPGSTCVWICGVEFPAGYDWRRDVIKTDVEANIFLIRDGEKVFSLPVKPSKKTTTEPNKHHFLHDAIYCEYCDTSGTYLLRNGKTYARFPGQWQLIGLLEKDSKIHSLWRAQKGRGIMLAEDETIKTSRMSAEAIGSLTSTPFWPTGALYESKGKICYNYIAEDSSHHVIRDGTDEHVWMNSDVQTLYDVRVIDGKTTAIYSKRYGGIFLRQGASETRIEGLNEVTTIGLKSICLFESEGATWFMCSYEIDETFEYHSVWNGDTKMAMKIYQTHAYMDHGKVTLMGPNKDGGLCYLRPDGTMVDIDVRSYRFSWRCACVHEGHTYIGITPREKGKPSIWIDGDVSEIPVNGFVTGVYVVDY